MLLALDRVTSTEVQDARKLNESWYTYKIKVHGGNKIDGMKHALLLTFSQVRKNTIYKKCIIGYKKNNSY